MAKQNEQEPSLWDQAQPGLGTQDTRRPERRLLPHDLDIALKYLSDGELKRLFEAVNSEAQRRGLYWWSSQSQKKHVSVVGR